MGKQILRIATLVASAGLLAVLVGCPFVFAVENPKVYSLPPGHFDPIPPTYRTIVIRPAQFFKVPTILPPGGLVIFTKQPESQTVLLTSNAMFSVEAVKVPASTNSTNAVTYQWQINPLLLSNDLYFTNIPGATNPTLTIISAGTNDVGYYRALAQWGSLSNVSFPVPLVLCVTGSLTVIGTPAVNPPPAPNVSYGGLYNGYVSYPDSPNSAHLWGFISIRQAVPGSATDPTPAGNQIEADGNQVASPVCGTGTINIPPPYDLGYVFTVFFSGSVPLGNYSISLTNFKQ
jgi:hypothetical protein